MKKILVITTEAIFFIGFLFFHSVLFGQQQVKADLKDFKIIIEKTSTGLKLHSPKGSAWIDLNLSLNEYQKVNIDEYGMTNPDYVSEEKDEHLADYLFVIFKTTKGVKLTGLEGTAWKELSFSLSEGAIQTIDQYGMAND